MRLVLFQFLAFSLVACSLANCIILQTVTLQIVILYLTCGLCFFLQQWVVRYGLIILGTDLVLKEFPRVRAHLAGLTLDDVSSRVLIFMLLHAFSLEFLSFNLVPF